MSWAKVWLPKTCMNCGAEFALKAEFQKLVAA